MYGQIIDAETTFSFQGKHFNQGFNTDMGAIASVSEMFEFSLRWQEGGPVFPFSYSPLVGGSVLGRFRAVYHMAVSVHKLLLAVPLRSIEMIAGEDNWKNCLHATFYTVHTFD